MKKITLEALLKEKRNLTYTEQYQYIFRLMEAGTIAPIKRSGTNGKSPSLPMAYRLVEETKDYSVLLDELKFHVSTHIRTDYYMKHPEVYEREREWVLQLSGYLEECDCKGSSNQISLNERSFQIWNREKFLQKEHGNQVLKHCGLTMEDLNLYHTSEPLPYYSASREVPQTILIIENKDTFYSMRKYFIEQIMQGADAECTIFGVPVKTLVYGAGKGILRSVEDFSFCVEPYMNHSDNTYLYFGDLDYEGIWIYERLAELFQPQHTLIPYSEGYVKMLSKAKFCKELPDTKEGQNRNLSGKFYTFFKESDLKGMKHILESGKYIPQEILNISDIIQYEHMKDKM